MRECVFFLLMTVASVCDGGEPPKISLLDIAPSLRTPNYAPYKIGSCVHASMANLMFVRGFDDLGGWWLSTYHSGETASGIIMKCDKAGLRYSYTIGDGDISWLEWVDRNRYGALIFYWDSHAVTFLGIDDKYVILLDNNANDYYRYVPRQEFVRKWPRYDGFALTLVYPPPPPLPTIAK